MRTIQSTRLTNIGLSWDVRSGSPELPVNMRLIVVHGLSKISRRRISRSSMSQMPGHCFPPNGKRLLGNVQTPEPDSVNRSTRGQIDQTRIARLVTVVLRRIAAVPLVLQSYWLSNGVGRRNPANYAYNAKLNEASNRAFAVYLRN